TISTASSSSIAWSRYATTSSADSAIGEARGRFSADPVPRSVIASAVRTPFGKLGGALKDYEATELGSLVIRNALDRAGLENDQGASGSMGPVREGRRGAAPGA